VDVGSGGCGIRNDNRVKLIIMTQQNLFDVGKITIQPNTRCKNCIHIVTHRHTNKLKYCAKQRANNTATGLKKIGANDAGCAMFELSN